MEKVNRNIEYCEENLELVFSECIKYSEKIKNPILNECCKKVLNDYKDRLINKPATDSHHNSKGGLLYHTYCVTRNAITISSLYPNLDIDLDLIIFGALLHDIGKTNDYEDWDNSSGFKRIGNNSQLLGHSYRGTYIVENYLNNYEIDTEFKNQALHMIGCHMIEFSDWGTLVSPKMLEVIIINYGDNIDAHIEPAHLVLSNAKLGEKYKIGNADREYYKSKNSYYNSNK